MKDNRKIIIYHNKLNMLLEQILNVYDIKYNKKLSKKVVYEGPLNPTIESHKIYAIICDTNILNQIYKKDMIDVECGLEWMDMPYIVDSITEEINMISNNKFGCLEDAIPNIKIHELLENTFVMENQISFYNELYDTLKKMYRENLNNIGA